MFGAPLGLIVAATALLTFPLLLSPLRTALLHLLGAFAIEVPVLLALVALIGPLCTSVTNIYGTSRRSSLRRNAHAPSLETCEQHVHGCIPKGTEHNQRPPSVITTADAALRHTLSQLPPRIKTVCVTTEEAHITLTLYKKAKDGMPSIINTRP